MEVRKGYKQTDVGVIPEDWNVNKIGNFTHSTSGGTPSTLISEYWGGDIRWMSSGELHSKFVYEVEGRITEEGLNNSSTKIIPEKCVLIGLAGQGKTRGTVAINMIELCTNQSIAAIFPSPHFVPEYLFYNLDTRYAELRTLSTGDGGRGGLNLGIINSLLVPLPPLPEQHAIAAALSDVDALLNSLDALIAKKRLIKQGAMQELLTGKRRLPKFDTHSGIKHTDVGILPSDWKVTKLGDVCQIFGRIGFRGYTKNDIVEKDYGVISISPSNIQNNQTDFTNCTYISLSKYEESPEIKIFNGDILLVKTGSTFGKTAIIRDLKEKATLNPQVVVLKNIKTDNFYLSYMMGFKIVQDQIALTIVGGAIPTLSQKQVAEYKLPIPSTKPEQTAIAEILSDMDAEISALEQKREKTRLLKQGMMQELLTGRIRLL